MLQIIASHEYKLKTVVIRQPSLIWVDNGTKKVIRRGERHICKPQEVLLLAAGHAWDVINQPEAKRPYLARAVSFSADALREVAATHAATPCTAVTTAQVLATTATLHEAVNRLAAHTSNPPISPRIYRHREIEVLLLLSELGWCFAAYAENAWAARVRQLVQRNLSETWTSARVAKQLACSSATLQRRLGDVGIAQVIRETRLESALTLLQTTQQPIGHIATSCGWLSHSRFTVAFTKRWGCSPTQVRAKLSENA